MQMLMLYMKFMQIILMTQLMQKNKIIANTLDDEKVHINIKTSGDVRTVVHYDNGTKISKTYVTASD